MIGIYKITSPSNRVYIGQAVNIENRKRIYRFYKSYKHNMGVKIYNSLNKYGFESHVFEIIDECTLEQLDNREEFHKTKFVDQFGWKLTLFYQLRDGKGGHKSEETKKKISEAKKGTKGYPKGVSRPLEFGENIKNNIERKEKIGKSNKGKERSEEFKQKLRKPKTKEHRLNISNNSKGITRNNKPILQYDLQGNFIAEYSNQNEASKIIGVNQSCISDVLRGRQKQTKGYVFKFKFG